MSAEHKTEEEEYHSSSDEDYDPEKDDGSDANEEIDEDDDVEDVEEVVEDVGEKKKKAEKSGEESQRTVDQIFEELTGMKAPARDPVPESEPVEKVYPKAAPSPSTQTIPIYPSKPSSSIQKVADVAAEKPKAGQKRVGLLDAAKSMKRSKTSVLDKSDNDWNAFKTEQNIKEDLESHNRGKGGYLNKMDFLNRTDNRQFEKERALRATARKE